MLLQNNRNCHFCHCFCFMKIVYHIQSFELIQQFVFHILKQFSVVGAQSLYQLYLLINHSNLMQLEKTSVNLISNSTLDVGNQYAFGFTCDPEDILDLFEEISQQLGFQLIERESTYCTSVKKPPQKKSIFDMINCFGCLGIEGVTAVKINLSRHSKKGKTKDSFVAEVKGLAGISHHVSSFLEVFAEKVSKHGYSLPAPKVLLQDVHNFREGSTENETPYYLQACTFHLINQLLLTPQHEINAALQKMLIDFQSTFKNIEESVDLLPLPMKNAISIVNDVREQLESLMNQLKYPRQLYPYLRISVESCVFSKIEAQLFPIYRLKNIKCEEIFAQKRNAILHDYSLRQIANEVCLSHKFWDFGSKLDEIVEFRELKSQVLFSGVCRQFEKMVFTASPREKIKHCQLGYTELKNHFYDYSSRKYELSSMEDIIPVLIIVVLLLEVGQLRSELDIMLDFISFDPSEMEAQKRLLINISESYNYIFRDWSLKH